MLLSRRAYRFLSLASFTLLPPITGLVAGGCGDDTTTDDGTKPPELRPGDICLAPQPSQVRLRFSPAQVFLPTCSGSDCLSRSLKVIVEPDFCADTPVTFASSDAEKLAAPTAGSVTLYKSEVTLDLAGATQAGRYVLTASVPRGDGTDATGTLDVVVLDPASTSCSSGSASEPSLAEGETLLGTGDIAGASIGLPPGANAPNQGSYLWSVAPFPATLACGSLAVPSGHLALGPAITFGPEAQKFQREVPLSVPVNPALLPSKARLRHVRVLYSGPAFEAPRVIPVADARFLEIGGRWSLSFKAPRLGTYQAIVAENAGTTTFTRRITHRAVIGVSMGGMGTSMFGFRHHDRFDVIAPLGGPAAWTWLMHYIENNHLAGFRPIAPGTVLSDIALTRADCDTSTTCASDETCIGKTVDHPGKCTLLGSPEDTYEHPQTFNNWWAEYPRTGTGGRFPRDEYSQIFRDLALLMGNPNGDNLTPGAENLPPGVPPTHKSVVGEHPNGECSVWVDPIGGSPNEAQQKEHAENCPAERCANTLILTNYYDDEFNPDGTFPVITVCDGTPTSEDETPWANAWKPAGPNAYPLEVGLAVDYNANGVRDELEPIIRSGHEPWSDFGTDGTASANEAGYVAGVNDDPAGDDFHAQFNPTGTERNFRWEAGEAFQDVGMDGVPGTPQQPAGGWQQPGDGYDVGEGDGQFTAARGLARMWDHDPVSMLKQLATPPGGAIDDAALRRIDVWTDGGTRDIFNFHVAAQHLAGGMVARGRDTAYYTDFAEMPGFDPSQPDYYTPSRMPWEDVPGSVMMRYGMIDPTAQAFENGNGQHVGTVQQVVNRLQTALYYIGSRWPEPELRSLVKVSNDAPAPGAPVCEIDGSCTFEFTDSNGRTGPVTVNLPPGYAHVDQQDRRYPVIFLLHGYGQTPEDLGAAIIFVNNWMNNPQDSTATRLPKAILVYVDGRCRTDATGKAECIRGGFFTDSVRADGFHGEQWWLELMNQIDTRFRTASEDGTEIEWPE